MISIRRQINESDRLVACLHSFVNAFLGVAAALPKTVTPASAELTQRCRKTLDQLTVSLTEEPEAASVEEAGKLVVGQIDEIARSNQAATNDFDATMKAVVATAAAAISSFRGHGANHESGITKLADGFESLARLDDVVELRRRLREDVVKLRHAAEQMRRDSEASAKQFESRISAFQQRLEAARKDPDIDRLTLLGGRRVAEHQIQRIAKHDGPICVLLFDIEGFRKINERYGPPLGDKLLQALAHLLRESFPEEGSLFRWGPDEFLAIAESPLAGCLDRCRSICARFARSKYVTYDRGRPEKMSADVAWGAAQYSRGESTGGLCIRARENLEQNRRAAEL